MTTVKGGTIEWQGENIAGMRLRTMLARGISFVLQGRCNTVFEKLLRLHASGLTILLVEQNTKKAVKVAERAVILRLGKVIWDEKPTEISHDALGELFLTGKMRGEAQATH